jgi:Tol biopolymer transport system component
MKTISRIAIALSVVLLGGSPALAQTGHDLFQQALVKERADGDLRGAIAIYDQIAREFASDRALTAKALVQMGECYEKLGSTEAERAYQRVVREYSDQNDLVARARSRLAALERAARASEEPRITTRRVSAGLNAGAHDATPDGKHLVWGDYQGTMNLAAREVATGANRYLTDDARYTPTWATAYGGRVSPDGKRVAHGYSEQDQGGSLRVVGMDGENLRELLREKGCWVQPYGWTSDGQQIAARWDCWSDSNPDGTFEIVLVSASDGTVRVVGSVPSSRYAFRSWLSPDDRYLVYGGPVEQEDGNADIWLLPLDGRGEVPLIQHPANDRLLGWVPGTSHVLFLSDRDGTWDLWAASVRDGAVEGPPRKVQRDIGAVGSVGFSGSGSFFYSVFTRWFTTSIAPFDTATGTASLESVTPLLGSNRGPTWSPDGEYLAFVTEPQPPTSKSGTLHVRHLATGEERELATHLLVRRMAGWSRDGRTISVVARDDTTQDPGYEGALYSVDVESGAVAPILDFPGGAGWPDGLRAVWAGGDAIIYSTYDDDARDGRLVWRDLESGRERELHRDSLLATILDLAPDGRHLVFGIRSSISPGADGIGNGGRLLVMDLEDESTRALVVMDESGYVDGVQWSPSGEYVLFTRRTGEDDQRRTEVFRVAASGGEPEPLWTFGEGKWGSWFELSPDGRHIALTSYTQETEIWVMENLKEVLSREP